MVKAIIMILPTQFQKNSQRVVSWSSVRTFTLFSQALEEKDRKQSLMKDALSNQQRRLRQRLELLKTMAYRKSRGGRTISECSSSTVSTASTASVSNDEPGKPVRERGSDCCANQVPVQMLAESGSESELQGSALHAISCNLPDFHCNICLLIIIKGEDRECSLPYQSEITIQLTCTLNSRFAIFQQD